MTPTEKMEMQIDEAQDGSAIVSLPANEDNPQADQPTKGTQDDDSDDQDDDHGEGAVSDDPEREAIRAARREERKLKKQLHREKIRESSHLVSALKKQNSDLANRIASLESRTSGAELARLDKAIDDAATRVEYAKMKMQEAVNTRQGEALTQAQELWYENQRQLESLKSMKDNASRQISQPKQNISQPDIAVQRNAAEWMGRNSWYDPEMKDADSKIAQALDKTLSEEGYDPSSQDYWEELDERLQKYLPHRYNVVYSASTRNSRPRSVVTSSGRETSGNAKPNEYRLTPDRVAAIKEAGMWENIELRNKMAKKYAEYDRQQKRG
jgi:hypothetical protein